MSAGMKILIAYDGSEHAAAALADLRRAGLPQAAEALVFSVAELTPPLPPLQAGSALAYAQALPPGQAVAAEAAGFSRLAGARGNRGRHARLGHRAAGR